MAYISAVQKTTGNDPATTPHNAGDYLVCFFVHQSSVLTLPSGWTLLDSFTAINGYDGIAYYKKCASSTETVPGAGTASFTESITLTIKGATSVEADFFSSTSKVATTDAGKAYTMDAITPEFDNSLILYFNLDGANGRHSVPTHGVIELARNTAGQGCMSLAYTYGGTAGVAVAAHDYIGQYTTTWGQYFLAVEIKDGGSGLNAGYVDKVNPPATLLHMLASSGQSGILNGTNLTYNPTTEIPSVTNDNTSYNDTATYNALSGEGSIVVGISAVSIENASTTTDVRIAGTDLASSTDLSGAIIAVSHTGGPRTPTAKVAKCIGLSDKTNSRIWQIDGNNLNPRGEDYVLTNVIEVDGGFQIDDIGTFNSSSIDTIILAAEISIGSTGAASYGFLNKLNTMILKGGSSGKVENMALAKLVSDTTGLNTVQNQLGQTDTQYYCSQSIRIDCDYWGGVTQSVSYPGAFDYANLKILTQVSSGALAYTLNPPSGKTHDISGWSFNMGNYHKWGIESGAAGTVLTSGTAVSNCTPVLNASAAAIGGFTISNSKEVTYTTIADMTGGGSFIGCVDSQQITITSKEDFEKLQNCDFSNCSALAIKITGDQNNSAGAWDGAGMTVSGGGGSYDIEYTGTTDFTIEFETGSGWSQGRTNNSSTGTLTIDTPTVSLTVNSNIASSDIKIFTTGTQTIIASATGTTASTTTAGTYDVTVQKAGYLPQRQTGVVLGTTNNTVNITLVKDPVYNASHGLAYTTDFAYNRATSRLTCSTRQAGRDFYSAMIDAFIAQSSLDNTDFPLTAVGIDSIFFNDDAELIDATSEDNWYDAGIRYIDSGGTTTAEWCSIKSSGSIPAGVTGRYQTSAGGGTTALRTTGAVNQIIQVYGDATHGNFDYRSYLVIKFQANPYVDTRSDILDLAGVATLEPFEYSVAIEPTTLDIAAGTGGAALTLVDHTAAPITVGGKLFSYEIQDGGTASAEDILRTWDYSIAQTGTYQSTDTFNLPEFIAQSGSTYETRRGIVETNGATLYGCYVSRGGSDHPEFTRHQSDDGTYYVKPVTANITITNLPDDVGASTRLQIYNVTTATIIYSDDPAGTGYSASYTDGVGITAGDSIRIRYAHLNGSTSFESGQTFVTASTSGVSADGSLFIDSDPVYAANAIDGSSAAVTAKFIADFVDIEVDLQVASNFTALEAFAYFCYTLTLSDGINLFWGGVDAVDVGNYKIVTAALDLKFDNLTTTNLRQTDTARIYRDDDSYPIKNNGATTGGGGVDVNWKNVVYVTTVTGSNVITGDIADVAAQVQSAMTTQGYTMTRAPYLDDIGTINTRTADILADTGTDIPATIAALQSDATAILADTNELQTNQGNWLTATGFATTEPDNASIAAIKTKTDQLTFTKANEIDANVKSTNSGTVIGSGTELDPWRKDGVEP